jgi:lipoyl(octanoyl) transferase
MEGVGNEVMADAFLCAFTRPVELTQAWAWQRAWQERLLMARSQSEAAPVPELLLLLEHSLCYSLGRGSSLNHLGFDPVAPPAPLLRLDRGGEITHHCPGQLVLYPVLDLQRHRCDLDWYLRQLEAVVIDVLAKLGLKGQRLPGFTGVWLEGRKLAAIGVGGRRWVTQHGLALNVDADLAGFEAIRPCGLERPVGRLLDWLPGLRAAQLRRPLADACAARFGWAEPRWICEQTFRSLLGIDG